MGNQDFSNAAQKTGSESRTVDFPTAGVVDLPLQVHEETVMGRGILLWMLGVPLPIILLLAMCSHN
jgi:hypothetical protein